ncbi:hypothetical protein P3T76_009846 [Phytophthora citrophthora]|uniref:PX domain-containing protein n=1 Tax=Phytophthora citrophthora TaxID=4793 RepID=A0AAD9GEP7_9STRA|nr:hypothetical protein P3T76_009846 [Phytophthora citrophthora]
MSLDAIVKVPPSPCPYAPQDTTTLVLLHYDGHFRLLERTLHDFQQLERQLQQNEATKQFSSPASVLPAIEAYYAAKPTFYPSNQLGIRLAIALEEFIRELTADADLLSTSALKMFLHGNLLTSHEMTRADYKDAVEATIGAEEEKEERVAAGCSVEHQLAVDDEQLVLWKFSSQGSGMVFSADFSSCSSEGEQEDIDPYSVSSNDVSETKDETETVQFRTNCDFKVDGGFLYGHFVAEKSGLVTLQWENVDMRSVVSKSLHFQAKVMSLAAAEEVLEIAKRLNDVDASEWLFDHISASEITSVEDLPGWDIDESEDTFDEAYDDNADEDAEKDPQIETAVLEERTHELEAQVMRLEESLTATKRELKSALDRVQIAEEIYKANLETITQLECGPVPKVKSKAEVTTTPPAATPGTQAEGPSSELERVQKLCADFQEQCLWRSVENMELETQLAASQVEASSWREKHVEQAAQLVDLEKQNRTLRTHKKMLVQEVKRLQPYSQVNLAALVQEAQEARMVQRSLQAKLNSHEQNETEPADFVLIEQDEEPSRSMEVGAAELALVLLGVTALALVALWVYRMVQYRKAVRRSQERWLAYDTTPVLTEDELGLNWPSLKPILLSPIPEERLESGRESENDSMLSARRDSLRMSAISVIAYGSFDQPVAKTAKV